MLQKLGCQVDCVANGKEAVKAVLSIPYDVLLMDCQMPILDGFQATAALRKWEAEDYYSETENRKSKTEKRIPIIAMTANAMKGDREKCLEAGMDDYISKPVDQEKLRNAIGRWIDGPRQEQELSEQQVKVIGGTETAPRGA